MSSILKFGLFTWLLITASAAIGQENFTTYWKNGFFFESGDKDFVLKFGGRIMYDAAIWRHDDELENIFGEGGHGVEFRRVRFVNEGLLYGNIEYKLQLDFAGGKVVFKDVYIDFKGVPAVGNIMVGHFKEPFGLDELISSSYITFIERALAADFAPSRNTGLMFHNSFLEDNLVVQAGGFLNGNDTGDDKKAADGYALTGRVAGTPYMNEETHRLVHLGVSFSHRAPNAKTYEISSRPEAHLAPEYISTGIINDVISANLLGTELAIVFGSLSLQGEYVVADVASDSISADYTFSSYYGQLSYFLTGESRSYKSPAEGFGRIKPSRNIGAGGIGAVEIALRYSHSKLNSNGIVGGALNDIIAGINWYLNPATRIMFNYVRAQVENTGNANIFQMRFQVDF